MQTTGHDDVMTVKEVAALFRIQQATVYELIKKGKLPAFKIGRFWRFNRSDIDKVRETIVSTGEKQSS